MIPIWLGIGLTPSGDDFLCGFLAGLRLSDGSSVFLPFLEQHILHTLDRTNEISAAFLRCAAFGPFSTPVHLLTDPNVTARQIYLVFSSISHSSDIDTLCGIYIAFTASIFADKHPKKS